MHCQEKHPKDEQYAEAAKVLADGNDILDETLPAGHWILGNTKSMRGYSLAQTGDYVQGYDLSLAGYQLVKSARGEENTRTRRTLRRLADVCHLMGEESEEAGYRLLLGQ